MECALCFITVVVFKLPNYKVGFLVVIHCDFAILLFLFIDEVREFSRCMQEVLAAYLAGI